MSKILYIEVSPMGDDSYSIQAAKAFLDARMAGNPDDELDRIDLFDLDLPAFGRPFAKAKMAKMFGQELGGEEQKAWERVEELIARFKAADIYVFAVPMWNFGVPHVLKQYIDFLVQPGYTFDPSAPKGETGLLEGKSAFVAYARGGEYKDGQERDPYDFQKAYLEAVLGLIGIKDVRSVIVQPTLAKGSDGAQQALEAAKKQARELALSQY